MDLKNVDFAKINSLTPDEVIVANVLDSAAKEAKYAEKLIYDSYFFHMGEEKIEIAKNGNGNCEYLTYDGKWIGTFAKKPEYAVQCIGRKSEIKAYLFAKTLLENGYVKPEDMFNDDTSYAEMNVVSTYLTNFIERTKKINENRKGGKSNESKNKKAQNKVSSVSKASNQEAETKYKETKN